LEDVTAGSILIPFVMTPIVAGIAWKLFIWQQESGVINAISACTEQVRQTRKKGLS